MLAVGWCQSWLSCDGAEDNLMGFVIVGTWCLILLYLTNWFNDG